MKEKNVMAVKFVEITFRSKPAIFTHLMIDRETVPKGCFIYGIRHGDENDHIVETAYKDKIDHLGTIILREQLKITDSGQLPVNLVELEFNNKNINSPCKSITDFIKKYPSPKFSLHETEETEKSLYYHLSEDEAIRFGLIGYTRADFGRSGNEFWSTWIDIQEKHKTPVFKQEFDVVMNFIVHSTENLATGENDFEINCFENLKIRKAGKGLDFKIITSNYSYYVRYSPRKNDYDMYIFSYLNKKLFPALSANKDTSEKREKGISTDEKIKVIIAEPGKLAYEAQIGSDLKSMQKLVGGFIEAIYLFEDPVALICNEDGKRKKLPLNRSVRGTIKPLWDIIVGTFFFCGIDGENFCSLSPEHLKALKTICNQPGGLIKVGMKILESS